MAGSLHPDTLELARCGSPSDRVGARVSILDQPWGLAVLGGRAQYSSPQWSEQSIGSWKSEHGRYFVFPFHCILNIWSLASHRFPRWINELMQHQLALSQVLRGF
ncbi:hypothetical protein LIA77_04819 [Sarocladium implicatum]|nr:hypothetical protein LIA77_04819 [Sarocladium implicatum]